MAKAIAKILGVVLLLIGIAGFVRHDLLGANLNTPHNAVHIVTGIIAIYFGFAGSANGARAFCLIFGAIYLLLGAVLYGMGTGPEHVKMVGPLMLGTRDHIIHVVVGIIFLAGGLLSRREG